MRIPPRTRYAVSAMLHLAMHNDLGPVPMAEISICQGISGSYVEQIFSRLRAAGLVQGYPGPGGGYRLAVAPGACSIRSIVDAMDDTHAEMRFDGHRATRAASESRATPARTLDEAVGRMLSESIDACLERVTLADLVDRPDIRASVLSQYDRQPWRCDVCGALSSRRHPGSAAPHTPR